MKGVWSFVYSTPEAERAPALLGVGFRQRFEPHPAVVAKTRLLAGSLHNELPPLSLQYVELVVSERVTNAVVHAATRFEVWVAVARTIRVDVTDGSCAPPIRRPATSQHPGGGGLRVVEACARRWGFEELVAGRVAWAELNAEPGESDDAIARPQRRGASRYGCLASVEAHRATRNQNG
jgi:hypothetical protein